MSGNDDKATRSDVHDKKAAYSFEVQEDAVQHPTNFTPYEDKQNRVNSFEVWDKTRKPSPERMAQAGFFYLGPGDNVICFSCRTELRDWKKESDPKAEHEAYLEEIEDECAYLQQMDK